jgi:hypothetical protein
MYSLRSILVVLTISIFFWFSCRELIQDEDSSSSPMKTDTPFYVGKYDGAADVIGCDTGESWDDRSAIMQVTFNSSTGTIDIKVDVYGTSLQGERIDIDVSGCTPGSSTLKCKEQRAAVLHEVSLSFSGSTATGSLFEYKQTSEGAFVKVIEANGTFYKK